MTAHERLLLEKIEDRQAVVGVVGLGYVGLPVALGFVEAGFAVEGVDVDDAKVRRLAQGRSHLADVDDDRVAAARGSGRLKVSTDPQALAAADAVLICVPTPLREGAPDLSMVVAAAQAVASAVSEGTLVVLESTTYPGTTEELLQPIFERRGLRVGESVFLAFSPERIDPGNELYDFEDIPKVVGGVSEACSRVATALYSQVVPKVITVSSPREAELSKLIENTFRHVNIGLINEIALYAREMGTDVWEAIEAAATKPFGFVPFWPGPGWGGHCIPLDPSYLSYRVRRDRAHDMRFVEVAHAVNSEMPRHVVERISELLNDAGKPLRGSRILGIGVGYKAGTDDTRESPALKVLSRLIRQGAEVSYHDPLVPELSLQGQELNSVELGPDIVRPQDLVVVFTKQHGVDWGELEQHAELIFDCCNAFGRRLQNGVRL